MLIHKKSWCYLKIPCLILSSFTECSSYCEIRRGHNLSAKRGSHLASSWGPRISRRHSICLFLYCLNLRSISHKGQKPIKKVTKGHYGNWRRSSRYIILGKKLEKKVQFWEVMEELFKVFFLNDIWTEYRVAIRCTIFPKSEQCTKL